MAKGKSRPEIVASHLQRILTGPECPAIGEHIKEVMRTADDDESSVRHLTSVVLQDVSLTMKVLRTANSPHYNRSGKGLLSVSHAVSVLGLDAIRDIAGSMVLLKDFPENAAGHRELHLLSLLTASHARAAASRIKYPHTEEAYLCGMFRNLGEILVSSYMPRKYGAILRRMKNGGASEQEACLRVLECSFEQIGQGACGHWKMPDRVRHCMLASRTQYTQAVLSQLDLLRALVTFSHGLTTAVHRDEPEAAGQRLRALMTDFGGLLKLDQGTMQEIAKGAIEETKSTFDLVQLTTGDLKLRRQAERALLALERGWTRAAGETPDPMPPPGERLMERLTEEVDLLLSSSSAPDLNKILMMVIEAIHRGGPFDRVVFGLLSPDHRQVRGRLGLGTGIDLLLERFRFPVSIRSGPVAVALLGQQDSFVHDRRYANTQFGKVVQRSNFGLMPVVVQGTAIAVLYFDRSDHAPPPDSGIIHQLARLRSLAAETIQWSRNETIHPAAGASGHG